jgi:hypothetical protein
LELQLTTTGTTAAHIPIQSGEDAALSSTEDTLVEYTALARKRGFDATKTPDRNVLMWRRVS